PRGPRRRRRAEPRSADQAEGTDDGVVEARPEVADPGLRAPEDGAIGTEGDGQPAREVDPQAHAGEAEMADGARREPADEAARRRALHRIGGVAGVEAQGPRALRGGHVALEGTGPAGGRSDPAGARQLVEDRLAEPGDVAGRAEEPGVTGDAVHHPGVVVVDLAGRGRPGRKGPEPLLPRCRLPRPRPAGGRDVAPRWGPGRGGAASLHRPATRALAPGNGCSHRRQPPEPGAEGERT